MAVLADGGRVKYREVIPSQELGRYIQCYWFLSSGGAPAAGDVQAILPDGRMELVLNLGDPFRRATDNGWQRQPLTMVVGQMGGPVVVEPTGMVDIIGIRFHPWGARAFIDGPLIRFRDELPGLDDVSGGLPRLIKDHDAELRERRRIASLEGILLRALIRRKKTDDSVDRAA